MTTIVCTATTRLTYAECLAALAACPALPVGERGATAKEDRFRDKQWHKLLLAYGRTGFYSTIDDARAAWRRLAAPLRRLRDERRAACGPQAGARGRLS